MQICSGAVDQCASISRCCVFGSVRINLVFTLQFDQRWSFIMGSSCVALNSGFITSHSVQNTHGYHVAATSSPHLLFFLLTTPEQSLRSCCHYQLMSCSGDSNIFSFPVMDTYHNLVLWMAQHKVQLLHYICWRIKRALGFRMCPIIVFCKWFL